MKQQHGMSIWLFIGAQLAIYGVLIMGSGIYYAVNGEPKNLHMSQTHPGVWWGAIMLALGLFYLIRFRPGAAPTGLPPHAEQ